jgi:glycosyltransferase involved in cell wall biosynthesis
LHRDTNKKTAILFIGPVAPPVGGMTISLNNLLSSGLKDKYDLYVLDITGCRARRKKTTILQGVFYQINLICKLVYILLTKNPRIVHVQMASFFYFYRRSIDIIICRIFGKKVIFHLRGASFIDFYKKSSAIKQWMIRMVLAASNRVIALSDYWKDFLSTIVIRDKISVVPNGVVLAEFRIEKDRRCELGIPSGSIVTIFIGPIGKRKGAFDVLDAIPKVIPIVENIIFLFCGTGELTGEMEAFKELIKEERFHKYVRYVEHITGQQLRDMYLASDIFVLPSYAENLPNSMLEAMAAGLPVVVSDVGAIPEIVTDGTNGFMIRAGDVKAIAEKIVSLATDRELRNSMSKRNLELIKEKYDMPIIAAKIDNIYRELI